ncbi:MAG: chemotaxis protein CheA [Acidimicrobiales bacterium]|nr:chemotaxis protein CheA [Acidimicrobiales bacterium]
MSSDDEIIQEFLVESYENLDQLDSDLVELEQQPGSRELLSSIFRTIHTIKGTSGFLALGRLEALTHVGENLLSKLRDGVLTMTPSTADALLRMIDVTRSLLAVVERTSSDEDDSIDIAPVIAAITACLDGDAARVTEEVAELEESQPVISEPGPRAEESQAEEVPVVVAPEPVAVIEDVAIDAGRGVADSTVRVDIDLLDTLVRLVGELVLTRNQILQQADTTADADLIRASQRLDLVASELQESVMRTRMQPIGNVWAKLPRVVRDLGAQLNKKVKLQLEGHETELDRSLLEAVKDSLTHLVRNSIDHGLELPADREAAGKPAEGTLLLRAFHESGQVVVEITDDGKGIDPDIVGQAAVRRGDITQEQLNRMDPRERLNLIFRPGFSTAAQVTNVSGRGVGMDVVRTNIERIGGTVDLSSKPGHGCTVRVRIPLTLAIIPALVVGECGEKYAIPQANLVELVRLQGDDLRNIETISGAPVLRLRGHLLPLVSMAGALGFDDVEAEAKTIVVLQSDDIRFGLAVTDVHDTQEIVVKPLGRQLKGIDLYAGATIMGDGRVSLILDVAGLAHSNGVVAVDNANANDNRGAGADITSLLVLDVGNDRRAALPLTEVSRLEEFPASAIERSGGTEVVQYRGGILPLVRLADAIGVPATQSDSDLVSVVVHDDGDVRVGIVVDRVIDVVETIISASDVGQRSGVLGSAVVQERVTDLVDLQAVVALAEGTAA